VKIRILASAALALFVAVGLWLLSSPPRERSESAPRLRGGVNGLDARGFSALDWAARNGRTDAIRELVREGADPNLRDDGPNRWPPLLHAVHKGQLASVRSLVTAGADVNGDNPRGLTPLMLACAQGEAEIVDELLADGADPRRSQLGGETALMYAMTEGDRRVIGSLLRKAPDLRLGDSWKESFARFLARLRGQSDVLARLDHLQMAEGRR